MKPERILFRILAILLLAAAGSGCATSALWDTNKLDAWNEPDDPPALSLFATEPSKDFLVVYREYHGRSDSIHVRAYWLNENEKRVADGRKPHFTNTRPGSSLVPIPVFIGAPTNAAASLYAIVATNGAAFRIYRRDTEVASAMLPAYRDMSARPCAWL